MDERDSDQRERGGDGKAGEKKDRNNTTEGRDSHSGPNLKERNADLLIKFYFQVEEKASRSGRECGRR